MKKHKFFSALTAAVVAISSALVFPSAAFAGEPGAANESQGSGSVTGTDTYNLTGNVQWMLGERQVGNGLGDDGDGRNICPLIDFAGDSDAWQLDDIATLGDFFGKYGGLEIGFQALDIQGSLEVLARIEVKNGDPINFTAQDVIAGKNMYTVSFKGTAYTENAELKSVAVYIRSKTASLAKFVLAEYDSNILSATGTQTLTKDFKPESDITVTVNKEQGPPPPDVVTIWGNGPNDGYSTKFPASDIIELYAKYKGGEVTFYVNDLDSDVNIVYDIILAPIDTVSSNNTLRSGKNTVKFNLPKISYTTPQIDGIILRFHADPGNTAEFKLSSSAPSEPETPSEPSTPSTPSDSSSSSSSSSSSTSSNTDETFYEENEVTGAVESSPDAAGVPAGDRITSITINPAFNLKNKNGDNVELDLSKIKIKAKEIYDEESLKRVEEALGMDIAGNTHYNLLDLTLLYNGEDYSNGYEGLVKVIIPLPSGHRDKSFSCYRMTEVNGKMVKEAIPGTQTEDSYIIYLEHFSLYALVADGGKAANNPTTGASDGASAGVALVAMSAAAVMLFRKNKRD